MHTKAEQNNQVDWVDSAACILGGLFLVGNGIRKGKLMRIAIGGYLTYKGIANNRSIREFYDWTADKISEQSFEGHAINIRTSMVINRPRKEVWSIWRNLSNLPLFMEHLTSVQEHDESNSDWEMELPGNMGNVQWNAQIVKEKHNELLAWKSSPDSTLQNAGKVTFRDALGGEGTAVDIVFSYHAPMGIAGEKLARLFNPMFRKMIENDIRNFKNFVETGNKAEHHESMYQ